MPQPDCKWHPDQRRRGCHKSRRRESRHDFRRRCPNLGYLRGHAIASLARPGHCSALSYPRATPGGLPAPRAAGLVHRTGEMALQYPCLETVARRHTRRQEPAAARHAVASAAGRSTVRVISLRGSICCCRSDPATKQVQGGRRRQHSTIEAVLESGKASEVAAQPR